MCCVCARSARGPRSDGMHNDVLHDSPAFEDAHVRLLSALGAAPGETSVAVTIVGGVAGVDQKLARLDLTHLVRNVNHHFESNIDGHDRKYVHWRWLLMVAEGAMLTWGGSTTQVSTAGGREHHRDGTSSPALPRTPCTGAGCSPHGQGQPPQPRSRGMLCGFGLFCSPRWAVMLMVVCHVVQISVHLIRQVDKSDIPYVTVHAVTLITMLRLGLLGPLVTRAYHQFVALPLYEDMAPWNIVFLGVRAYYARGSCV